MHSLLSLDRSILQDPDFDISLVSSSTAPPQTEGKLDPSPEVLFPCFAFHDSIRYNPTMPLLPLAAPQRPQERSASQQQQQQQPHGAASASRGSGTAAVGSGLQGLLSRISGRQAQLGLLVANIFIVLSAAVSLVPLNRALAYRAYFLCLRVVVLSSIYKVVLAK